MKPVKLLGAALLAATCLAGTAKAEELNFLFNDSVGDTLGFNLSSTPTPQSYTEDAASFLVDVTHSDVCCGAVTAPDAVTFYEPSDQNSFLSFNDSGYGPSLRGDGSLFTGSSSAPVFAPETTRLIDYGGNGWTVTISAISAAPEPSPGRS